MMSGCLHSRQRFLAGQFVLAKVSSATNPVPKSCPLRPTAASEAGTTNLGGLLRPSSGKPEHRYAQCQGGDANAIDEIDECGG